MIWLNRFEKYENRFIKTVAATSFTIFFIHPYILFILYQSPFAVTQIDSWLLYIAIVISMIGTSVLVALTTKKLFPNVSRFLVGY